MKLALSCKSSCCYRQLSISHLIFRPGQIVSESEIEDVRQEQLWEEDQQGVGQPTEGATSGMCCYFEGAIWSATIACKEVFFPGQVCVWVGGHCGGSPCLSLSGVLSSCPLQQYHFWCTSNDAEWKAIKPNIVKFLDIFNFAIFAFKSVLLQGGTFILDIAFPRGFKLIPYLENYLNILSMAASKCSLSRVPLQTTNSRLPYKDLSLQHQLQGRKEKVC